jgi:transcriptional regulator with XRE-family HTH domain
MEKQRGDKRILLGRRIRDIRKAKVWTQEEMGSKADVSYKFIGEIERGQQNPSFDTLVKIAEALNVELIDLSVSIRRSLIERILNPGWRRS